MILPTKYIPTTDTALGRAATILSLREGNLTVSELWNSWRAVQTETTFDGFVEALTLLFIMGAVTLESGILRWQV